MASRKDCLVYLKQHSTQASSEASLLSRYDEIRHGNLDLIGRIH
jgi:hypothetical protein